MRVNADDDKITLGEMLRQERFGAGAADQKDLDAQFARAIATDGTFAVWTFSALRGNYADHYERPTSSTWTTMQRSLRGKRCAPTP